ncbi:MAG: efflux RND transporter periplasmic adaptor subunit [Verrucomicrobiia bacterium]
MAEQKKPWIKWGIVFAVVGMVVGGGWWYWRKGSDGKAEYQTEIVSRGDLIQSVTATGQLNPETNVTVGSQISGIISHLYADWNSHVTNGQVVALIDPATYQANVQQCQGDLANARATLELAQVNARRAKELFDGRLIPQSDYDTSVANLHQAEATVLNKEATVANAQVNLDRCTIVSPVDGIVISRNVDVGQTVAASLSAPTLFQIANDLGKMQIDANVAEADIGGVAVGQKADFTVDAFPNRTFHGVVTQVRFNPITVQNVVTYDTVIGVSNLDLKLMPGMTANVSIIIAERNDVLKIPNAALRFHPPESTTNVAAQATSAGSRSGGGPGGVRRKGERRTTHTVYMLQNDKLQPVQVKTGISDGSSTELIEGLSESNTIVTAAFYKQTTSGSQPANPFGGGMRRF